MSRLVTRIAISFALTASAALLAQQTVSPANTTQQPTTQQPTTQQPTTQQPTTQQPSVQRPNRDMGSILIEGLKNTDGCIGVKTCQWTDGKRSIVAWFKNKESAVSWYYSTTHQAMIGNQTDGLKKDEKPMQYIDDADQPIMVIASLTPSSKPELPGIKIPISQISIELFAALPGGAQIGGRVSPAEFNVPHMRDYTPPKTKSIEDDRQLPQR